MDTPDNPNSPIFTKCYAMVSWIVQRMASFPKDKRATLGERLGINSLKLLENITDALFTRSKLGLLNKADRRLGRVRILLRLARELKCLTPRQHEHVIKQVDEVGRMLGGWIQQQRKK